MSEYRLSIRARADLIGIYVFTNERFGRYQAEAYHSGFERTFSLLAEFPGIGSSADELAHVWLRSNRDAATRSDTSPCKGEVGERQRAGWGSPEPTLIAMRI